MFSRNRVEPAGSAVVIRDGRLRQRGGGGAHVEIEESLLQPDQDAPVRGDSMSLFATLVPPPLRKSKKNFTSGKRVFFSLILTCVRRRVGVWWYGSTVINQERPKLNMVLATALCVITKTCA